MAKKSKKKKKSQYDTVEVTAKIKKRFKNSSSIDRFTDYAMIPKQIQVKKKSKKKTPKFEIKRRFSAF